MAVEFRNKVINELRRANIQEFNSTLFIASERIFKNSGRFALSEGIFVLEDGEEMNVVIKSVSKSYAIGRRKHTETEQYKERLFRYFAREAEIWIRARSHPNIATIIGFMPSVDDTRFPAFVFPFYATGDLRRYASKNTSMTSLKTKLQLLLDVANGLQHLHGLMPPIVHRDLTASNVLLKDTPSRVVACISDFGSAKLMDPALGVVCKSSESLSYEWSPPEHVRSKTYLESYTNPHPSGDVWSFGCVFLEVLTGNDPWPQHVQVVTELRNNRHPPRPIDIEIKEDHWAFLREGCWKSHPRKRYPATRLISEIQQLIEKETQTSDGH